MIKLKFKISLDGHGIVHGQDTDILVDLGPSSCVALLFSLTCPYLYPFRTPMFTMCVFPMHCRLVREKSTATQEKIMELNTMKIIPTGKTNKSTVKKVNSQKKGNFQCKI